MIGRADLQERLRALCEQFQVPGAAVAVARGDESVTAWTGTANLTTGAPVVKDTLFAAGSVTKVFTASLLMALVDDGLVDLDGLVVDHLPGFSAAGDPRSSQITVRMLLNHTSGLAGSVTWDLPKGPDVVERFVDRLQQLPLNSPPGEHWSYSNGGLVVAGRIAELVTGMPFNDALAERILRPLALNATSDTDEMILRSVAIGHVAGRDGSVVPTPRFQLGTNAPSGSALACDIGALLSFARMHLSGGVGEDGKQVLSEQAVSVMRQPTAEIPAGLGYSGTGVGWMCRETAAGPLLAHTGASAGQHSMLTILPEQQGVIAALTNGIGGPAVYATLLNEVLGELFGVAPEVPPTPPVRDDVDVEPFLGTYVADEGSVTIAREDGRLVLSHSVEPAFADVMRLIYGAFPPPPAVLSPVDEHRFLAEGGLPVQFVLDDEDRPAYAHVGRIYRRAD